MKEATQRIVGVAGLDGVIVASSDLSSIGKSMGSLSEILADSDSLVVKHKGNTFKSLEHGSIKEYAVYTEGEDDIAKTICVMAAIAVNEAGIYFEENHDKRSFVKTIISENILPGDIFIREKELNFTPDALRGVFLIRLDGASNLVALDTVQNLFPDKQNDFVFTIGESEIVIVKEIPDYTDTAALIDLAQDIHDLLATKLRISSVIGVGTPARSLGELAGKYKQAMIAIDIGRVFDIGAPVVNYENLGISRLIYQLPVTLCRMYLTEVLKKNPIEALDAETLYTIDKFFENSLNVSETSRKLFVHRNTLVYRLDKIEKITGLDLRKFDHAIVFKVALMVNKYLTSQEPKS